MKLTPPLTRHRSSRIQCYACTARAIVLCDHPRELPGGVENGSVDAEALVQLSKADALRLTTCSRPACGAHSCYGSGGKHLCKDHAQEIGKWA